MPIFKQHAKEGRCRVIETSSKWEIRDEKIDLFNRVFGRKYCQKITQTDGEKRKKLISSWKIFYVKKVGELHIEVVTSEFIKSHCGQWIPCTANVSKGQLLKLYIDLD